MSFTQRKDKHMAKHRDCCNVIPCKGNIFKCDRTGEDLVDLDGTGCEYCGRKDFPPVEANPGCFWEESGKCTHSVRYGISCFPAVCGVSLSIQDAQERIQKKQLFLK